MVSTLNCEPGKLNLLFVAFLRVFYQQQEKKLSQIFYGGQRVVSRYVQLEEPPKTCGTGWGRRQKGSVARGKLDVDLLSSGLK